MGRHSAGGGAPFGKAAAAVVAAAAIIGGGYGAYAALSNDDTPDSMATSSPSSATSRAANPQTTTSPTASAPTTSTSPSPSGPPAAATAAIETCTKEIAAGETLAKAAAASARDWGAHAGAQWDLDAGKITFAEAEIQWAKSKKPGPADVAAFKAADRAYAEVRDTCSAATDQTQGTALADKGKACAERATALKDVAVAGRTVNDQWAGHIKQMAGKAHNAGPAYHAEWMERTSAAKGSIKAYDKAAAALKSAPKCA